MRAIRLMEPKHFEYVEIDEPGPPGPGQAPARKQRVAHSFDFYPACPKIR